MVPMPYHTKHPSYACNDSTRVARCALLTALALIIAVFESFFPLPVPVFGMKLGLANIVTVITAFWLGSASTVIVLAARIILTAIATGQFTALPFSLAGGACALIVTLAFAHTPSLDKVRLCSLCAACAHNIAQVGVAVIVTATPQIVFYLPALLVSGLVTGFITGTIAKALLKRIAKNRV